MSCRLGRNLDVMMTPVYHIIARSRVVKKHTNIRREHTTEARYDTTIIQHEHTMIIKLRRCPEQGRLISKNVPVDDCGLIAAIGGLFFPATLSVVIDGGY